MIACHRPWQKTICTLVQCTVFNNRRYSTYFRSEKSYFFSIINLICRHIFHIKYKLLVPWVQLILSCYLTIWQIRSGDVPYDIFLNQQHSPELYWVPRDWRKAYRKEFFLQRGVTFDKTFLLYQNHIFAPWFSVTMCTFEELLRVMYGTNRQTKSAKFDTE